MSPTADLRVFLSEFYVLAPFFTVMSGVVVLGTDLGAWVLQQMPPGLSGPMNIAMYFFPFTWLFFTLACAFGMSFEQACKIELQGWKFAARLIGGTLAIFIAQASICSIFAMAGFAFLDTIRLH